jgi:hypothetical protein
MTCKKCEKSGLSILLVRPTAVATDPEIAPQGAAALATHAPTVDAFALPKLEAKSKYALRLLRREGYVYVFFPNEKPEGQIGRWLAWRVHDKAALMPQGEFVFEDSSFACDKKITHPHDVRTLCIAEPKRIAKVWIGFSMNWWSDKVKAQVSANLKAAGMVEVDLAGKPPVHGFLAEAPLLNQHVADYALQSLKHGGLEEEATPFYPAGDVSSMQAARSMAEVMRKQSEGHEGRSMVVAIPDPVGLAADLNGMRLAVDRRHKQRLLAPGVAWPLASNQLLKGLKEAFEAAAATGAEAAAYGGTSAKQWDAIKDSAYIGEMGYAWESTGGQAQDGSANGRMRQPDNLRQQAGIQRSRIANFDRLWREQVSSQIDEPRRAAWENAFQKDRRSEAEELAPFERNWLAALRHGNTLAYFKHHFDDDAPNRLTDPICHGLIYAQESDRVHVPQPLSLQACIDDYRDHVMAPPITDPRAVAARAMVGNQKSVIEQVAAMLDGEWDRSNENNMRDKVVDIFKGMLTTSWGRKHSWMVDIVAGLAAGHLAAMAAAVFQGVAALDRHRMLDLPRANELHVRKLVNLGVLEQALLQALNTAANKGEAYLPVVINEVWDLADADAHMRSRDYRGYYSDADRQALLKNRKADGTVTVKRMWFIGAHDGSLREIPSERAHAPGKSAQSLGGLGLTRFDDYVKAANLQQVSPQNRHSVQDHLAGQKANAKAEIQADRRLGHGVAVVQAAGLIWAIRDFWKSLDKPDRQERFDQALNLFGGMASFTASLVELRAVAYKSMLSKTPNVVDATDRANRATITTKLASIRVGLAVAGLATGGIDAYMSYRRAVKAQADGDEAAHMAHLTSQAAFGMQILFNAAIAADAISGGASSRAIGAGAQRAAQLIVKRGVERGVIVAIAGMSARALGVAVLGAITPVGWSLLAIGVLLTIVGTASERNRLQRWASRSHFGKDRVLAYKSLSLEMWEYDTMDMDFEAVEANETKRKVNRLGASGNPPPSPSLDAPGTWG